MSSILALDPGFGNTKVCLNGELSVMPSIIVQPKHLGRAGLGIKSAKNITEVFLEGHHFTVGAGAVEWGNPLSNLDYSALASLERQALFYAALSSLIQPGDHAVDLLVIGLPVPLLQDEHLSTLVLSDLKGYKGLHSFTVGKDEFSLDIQKLKVLPQPLGAYADWLLDDDLRPRANAAQAEAAILDIGMNTVDLYAVRGGRVEPRFVAGGKVGVRKLLERLDGGGRDLEELDSDLRQGRLALPSAMLQSWLGEIMATIERTMPKLSRFTAVIPAGGGALLLGDLLRLNLASRGAAIYWPGDPIGCNARGLWKWSAYGARH